jgi:hypothetical protein
VVYSQACTSLNGLATTDDTELFIQIAQKTYVPTLLDVLNRTIAARPTFAADDFPGLDFVSVIFEDLKRYNASNALYLGNLTEATPVCLVLLFIFLSSPFITILFSMSGFPSRKTSPG